MQDTLVYLQNHWKALLGWVWLVAGIVLAIHIVLQKRSPASTLAWILALFFISPIGLLVYRFFGPQRITRQSLRRMRSRMLLATQSAAPWSPYDREAPAWFRPHSHLIEASSGIPASSLNSYQRLLNGKATFDAILQDIAQAKHHIHLEYYIFEPDQTGQQLLKALQARLREGVKVRLLLDGVGAANLLKKRHRHLLEAFTQAGGEYAVFHPARLDRWRPMVNLRTHRKIVVVDGHIGYTGGVNITDDENEAIHPQSAYRDTHLRFEGAGVRWLQFVFLQDWVYASGRHQLGEGLFTEEVPGTISMHLAASGPDNDGQAIHHSVLHAINTAQNRIWLTTPYFVPTDPAYTALINAARRGVDVQLLVPLRSDSLWVTWAARSYFTELLAAGVKIYEYHERMLHAKTLLVDEGYSMVGTANFDNRSFLLNFEIAVVLYDRPLNQTLAEDFRNDLRASRRRHLTDQKMRLWQRFPVAFARLLSPLL